MCGRGTDAEGFMLSSHALSVLEVPVLSSSSLLFGRQRITGRERNLFSAAMVPDMTAMIEARPDQSQGLHPVSCLDSGPKHLGHFT